MKILDIEAVYGWKAELLARAVVPGGSVMRKIRKRPLRASRIGSMRGSRPRAAANIVSVALGDSMILRQPVCMISIS